MAIAWKEKPRRFVEPPLVTSMECLARKQGTAKEMALSQKVADMKLQELGSHVLSSTNNYFEYFKQEGAEPLTERKWTVDRVREGTELDTRTPRDTSHPMHSDSARRRCKVPLLTHRQLRTSQAYGWLPPIDDPNLGFGRNPTLLDSSMDKSTSAIPLAGLARRGQLADLGWAVLGLAACLPHTCWWSIEHVA
eukprot:CAMPEP_0171098454 /NCGR_PEP_ID=MMETSP0766_2-20121228/48320_1 /TAXON_ID=439317 /ORGANISM="Gambierdiscus australes, Strain CAWD 149" /LENGTH=192 /DNA_ID=CAMNT_0011557795 /DNA_START=30 /DNA_END=605 /DNA_ORIENTATION=+